MQAMEAALRHWPGLAAEIGEAPDDWRASVLASRDDARVSRVLLLLRHGDGRALILKHEARPVRPDVFAASMQAHLAAQEGFAEGVPSLLAFDLETQTAVMTHVPGAPLAVVLEGQPLDRQLPALQMAGGWLARFHRGGLGDERIFQPKHTLRFLREILDELARGDRDIAEGAMFRRVAEALCAKQAAFEGQKTIAAATHGDMHMRNVLIGQDRAWGIDFAGGRIVPVGHDIGRLLADYAILRAPRDAITPGKVLPARAQEAFFAGYDLVQADDPSVRLLIRHRVLAEWWGVPARRDKRSMAAERRLAGVLSLIEAARLY